MGSVMGNSDAGIGYVRVVLLRAACRSLFCPHVRFSIILISILPPDAELPPQSSPLPPPPLPPLLSSLALSLSLSVSSSSVQKVTRASSRC